MRLTLSVAAILLLGLATCRPREVVRPGAIWLLTGTAAALEKPSPPAVTRGMKKEHVRMLWGEPVAVRKIRTCFGTQEEWVYRGDPQRYGGEERTLLFDEDDVLDEIK